MQSIHTYRPLSQVEAEMQKALTAYTGAEERLQNAQASVDNAVQLLEEARSNYQTSRREYDAALETLDACQFEMEASFAALQESSPNSSMWQRSEKISERNAVLGLRPPSDNSSINSSTYVEAGKESINIISQ